MQKNEPSLFQLINKKMRNRCIAFCLLMLLLGPLHSQLLEIRNLQCEYLSNPLGIDSQDPQLSWNTTSADRNSIQTAYRILVADDPELLKKNIGNIWDSKKVLSDQSIQVLYAGSPLKSAEKYYWKVMVWDNRKHTLWSNPAMWQMGLLTRSDWKNAEWIAYENMPDSLKLSPLHSEQKRAPIKDILPIIRKEFFVKKAIKNASVFIAGLGHFELSINGTKTSDHFLDAGWTNYDKHALYVSFDITGQLKQGANAIGVMLGNGFYFIPGDRYRKLQLAYGYPKMICRIFLEYTDGSSENIVSDLSWKTSAGPITFSSIYGGEDYNATLEQKGWDLPGFNDKLWKASMIVDGPEILSAQTATPLKIFDHFITKKITHPAQDKWVYDLGQNASGIPSITVKGKKGAIVRLWPAELLAGDGTITTEPIGKPVYFEYTLKGGGIETWQPRFTYYGFRYVQVEGGIPSGKNNPDQLPEIIDIKGLHTRNAAETVGSFSCSDKLFNKTDTLINWGIKSNMASVLTDCPHREKLGWLEEVHLVGPSIRYNYDIAALGRKIVRDMMMAQTDNGLIPDIAPEYAQFGGGFRDSPEWGSNGIILPWYLFDWYGDKQILAEAYPMMQRYIFYLQNKLKDGLLSYGLGDWYDIGPKPPGPSQLTPKGITATAMYYYDLTLLNKTATVLGKYQDAETYQNLAQKIKTTYNTAYFNKETKQYATGSQTANAMSVYMQLAEPEYKEDIINNIVKELRTHNNSLTSGDIGYRYLLRVLDDNDRSDVIYDMNSNPKVPGYGYQLERGATALTESWQAFPNASNNHMMLGHLMEWFYSGLAGIRPAKNTIAFKEIEIRPQPVGNISSANASYRSPYGTISSNWKKTGTSFELTIEAPFNTTAYVYLPAKDTSHITESNKSLDGKEGVKVIKYEKGYQVLRIGSGKYHFTVK